MPAHKIAILSYSGQAFFELACAVELFVLKRPEIPNWYHTDLVTFEESSQTSNIGIALQGARQIATFAPYDTIVISSWPTTANDIPEGLAKALIRAHKQGKRLLTFCSGSFLLARLGILNGRSATTHWRYADEFIRVFPLVNYVGNVLYIYENNIGTSAGSAAALDLGLAVIREDFNSDAANKVARRMVVAAHRNGGQAQFVETPLRKRPDLLGETLDWALKNLDKLQSVEELAQRACMSRRTFDRKFRASMNLSPQMWIVNRRIELARQLLEKSDQHIEAVAEITGFDTPETLRHHFRKQLGLSPSQYRNNFRAV